MFNHQVFDLIRAQLAGLWPTDLKQTVAWAPPRPTGSELRNPADPAQARRIEAARLKRERRAQKLYWVAKGWVRHNTAHKDGNIQLPGNILSDTPARLNPLYIAK